MRDGILLPNSHKEMAHMIYLANFIIANVGLNYGRDAWSIFGEQDALEFFKVSEEDMQDLIIMAHDTIQEVKGSLIPNQKATAPEI